ncbi:MAG: ABC transporter permease [ANME-2 cluster archaeon]|nr:ABC transporter permease [ANME-2 cluster archaeon]MBC2700119.1 ABC transporter permease [ANME-2 cluster archaeon]MBC2708783.1 ABC transporter permease [ANME-2 cluster archaeon]MBC2748257.1 ABC transporter permease [ANME-2 cluster archaeon]MBC2763096.1 ABC transporter permease [ANME-2 cluster archaeon]
MIAKYEFLKTVKRKEFILMTLGFPLFFILIMLVPLLLAGTSSPEDLNLGYIDKTNSFEFPDEITVRGSMIFSNEIPGVTNNKELDGTNNEKYPIIKFTQYSDVASAKQDLGSGTLSGYLIIPEDYIKTGIVESYVIGKLTDIPQKELSELMVNNLLKDKVDEETLQRVKDPITFKRFSIETTGEVSEKGLSDLLEDFALPYLTGILLLISIFTSSGYLLQSVAEEKESRIIEILLSSVTPIEMLTGKIIGLGSVGLLQIAIWLSVGFAGLIYVFALSINPFLLILSLAYFILGFLLFASMMGAVGAISGSMRESQQLIPIFTFPAIAPIFFMQVLITEPEGTLSMFFSMFPLTSPVAMLIRMGVSDVPLYQIAVSLIILIVSVYFVIIISARLFRVGLLMYGKRPAIGEIVRYMKTG